MRSVLEMLLAALGGLALVGPATTLVFGRDRSGMEGRAAEEVRVQAALRAKALQQATVARLGPRGLGCTDVSILVEEATSLVADTLDMEYVQLLELLPEGDSLLLRAGVGWKDGLVGRARVGAESGSQAGYTLLSPEPVIVEDLETETRFSPPALLRDHGVVSGVGVALSCHDRPCGILGVYTTRPRALTQDDIHFLEAVAHVLGAAIDRRRTEQALRDSEEQLRSLYLAVSGGVVVYNREGTITDANETACEILGLPLEKLRGRTSADPRWDSVHEDGSPFPADSHPAMVALRTGQAVRSVVMGIHHPPTGARRWILVNAQPVLDPSAGATQSAVATFVEITEHKHAKDSLRFLAEAGSVLASSLDYETTLTSLARLAVPSMADWCSVDVIGGEGKLQRVAVAHADPIEEDRVRELHRRYPPDPNAAYGVPHVLRTGRPEIYPDAPASLLVSASRDDGQLQSFREVGFRSAMVVPLIARGRTLGAISFVAGEPARRYGPADLALAEDLARLAALAVDNARLYREARKAIQARDEFLSVAAHELKTPITSLRGFAQLAVRLIDREGVPDPNQTRQALLMIDHQSRKLAQQVAQLLDFSRLEAGRMTLDRRVTGLARLVQDVVALAAANADGHTFALQVPPSASALVDPALVERVVVNLVDNSIRYSPGGGPIEIEVSTPDPETVRLTVRDHGIGILPEHRDRVFDRFSQAHASDNLGGMGWACTSLVRS